MSGPGARLSESGLGVDVQWCAIVASYTLLNMCGVATTATQRQSTWKSAYRVGIVVGSEQVLVARKGGFCSVSVRLHVCASPVLGTIETTVALSLANSPNYSLLCISF
jgi:hypothetical protein